MKRFLPRCILLCFLFANFSCIREVSESRFSEVYNLGFNLENKQIKAWRTIYRAVMELKLDSTQLQDGKAPLKIVQPAFPGTPALSALKIKLRGNLQQRLAVHHIQADTAEVLFTCKSQHLADASLTVSGIDRNEDLLYSKTISCISEGKWSTLSLPVPLKDIAFLHLEIEANGSDSLKDEQVLWLDKIQINAHGKNIGTLKASGFSAVPDIDAGSIVPLSFDHDKSYAGIPELPRKRILAIGESVHGSMQANEAAMQLIKYQVANNDCKLILMEMPLAKMLSYNRFIQGDEDFKLDSLMRDFHSLVSVSHFTDLLLWLKEYNRTAREKVWLMGMDTDIRQMSSAMWLFDYLFTINQAWARPVDLTRSHPVLRELCAELVKPKVSFSTITALLKENKDIDTLLGSKEYQILRYCLEMNGRAGARSSSRRVIRDSLMYQNSLFLLNLLAPFPKRAIIYSHLLHSNYKTTATFYLSPSFGSCMKQKFGKEYSCIGILIGEGEVLGIEGDSLQKKQLQISPRNSIEYVLNKQRESYLYLPAPSGIAQIRYLGLIWTPGQFGAMAMRARMDALIFIRSSEPIDSAPRDSTISYLSSLPIRKFMKNFERNKLLQMDQPQGSSR